MNQTSSAAIRLLYITYHENVLYSGILRSQVQKMLAALPAQESVDMVCLLCFINPWHFWRDRTKWRELRLELAAQGVQLVKRPLFFTSRWHWLTMALTAAVSVPMAIWEVRHLRINMLHSRGYVAGLIAQVIREVTGVAHIFDPRGPFTVEMTTNRIWRSGGSTHRFWQKVESWLIRNSSAVVGVTPGYRGLYARMGAKKAVFIPNRGDVNYFAEKSQVSNLSESITLGFCGGMESVWYNPELVGRLYLGLRAALPVLKLFIITHADRKQIQDTFRRMGIADSDWSIQGFPPSEVPEQLARCHLGLLFGVKPEGIWPVKIAEYLACGLPLIVEKKVGEHLTRLVEKWELGVVVDEDYPASFQGVKVLLENRTACSLRCREYALKRLDISRTSRQTARLYRQVLRIN